MGFISHNPRGGNEKEKCNIINIRCAHTQRQMALANIWGKRSLVDYCKIKVGVGREEYIITGMTGVN